MNKLTIAVLYGGNSPERAVSLVTGKAVIDNLDPKKYEVSVYDTAKDLKKLVDNSEAIDLAFIALHGEGGEDGTIQGLLQLLDIPYTFSGLLPSAIAMDKAMTKRLLSAAGVKVAGGQEVNAVEDIEFKNFPAVVKPNSAGSSVAISIVNNLDETKIAVKVALEYDPVVLIEEYLVGTEITVATLGNLKPKALPVIEIVPQKGKFYDYASKYEPGGSIHHIPARIDHGIAKIAQDIAVKCHLTLGLGGAARTDMIITNDGPVVLEINTIPGMTPTSLLPEAAKAAGIAFPALLDKLIALAQE